ncbi:MAG: tRNA uridine-5-carboxymethylaminomethyl(34) synthesis GTPase MnmE [Betaproteobacteria bacterium]|nr:tRNA uridine-5-carboxymethylaminomethyl(34) synthesis GTPase MnmE [Betaproteobacteria bacterium]
MTKNDTIAAIASAVGRSGIGIVRISGSDLGSLIVQLLGRRLAPRRAVLANFLDARGEAIDQGIALHFPAPHSYTGEDVLELQGHGGPVVLQLLLRRCLELGARLAEPGEFTKRAFLNDKLDLAQAESVADLIDATTAQAARCALRSLQGSFSERVGELSRALVELRTLVEATLDFPEEEIDFLKRADAEGRLARVRTRLDAVLEASQQGSLLREGMHVVLAGQPNVGKSSLLNRMAGEELAIVTDIPGTTRDAIRQSIDVNGVPAHIIDTAGLRDSHDPVEKLGIARTWAAIEKADVMLLVVDCTEGETAKDRAILAQLPGALPCIRVMNKIDLIGRAPGVERASGATAAWVSAKTGAGVDLLRQALLDTVGWHGGGEGLFMARERHLQALHRARRHLEQAVQVGPQLELFAEELRLAQEALGAITGEYHADDLLGEIFSRFCVGK